MNDDIHTNNIRVAKNTIILYIRMVFLMIVTLYTSRVIINVLGFYDYGIYTAVGGFVAMFGVISNSLTAAIGRFITFELGHGNKEKLNSIFSTSLLIQSIIAGVIIILAETVGIWFLNVHMTIPSERLYAANIVLQFSIITFAIQLISVPYNAAIIAHENMGAYAVISIINGFGTLLVAFSLKIIDSFDKLIAYSILIAILTLLVRVIYGIYCKKHFQECKFILKCDKSIIKEITLFAGWNFFGASAAVLRDQGVNVLLNIFCGPIVNAARGIAMQVSGAIQSLSGSFLSALSPQITKQYANRDIDSSLNLCFKGARFSYYLLLLLGLPIFVEAEQILTLWLGDTPDHAVSFVRLIVVYVMVEAVSTTLITLMLATGNIKRYQIIVGGAQLLNFPLAYLILKLGLAPEYTVVATIFIACLCLILRLLLLRKMVGLSIRKFVVDVVLNVVIVSFVSLLIPISVIHILDQNFLRLVTSVVICILWSSFIIISIGCSMSERSFFVIKVKQIINKSNDAHKQR